MLTVFQHAKGCPNEDSIYNIHCRKDKKKLASFAAKMIYVRSL